MDDITKKVIIGEGDIGCSAIVVHYDKPDISYPHISQNKNSYWICDVFFDGSEMVVFKNTEEGEDIELFFKQQMYSALKNYLERLLLTKAPLSQIHQWVLEIREKSIKQGEDNLKCSIRNLLFEI